MKCKSLYHILLLAGECLLLASLSGCNRHKTYRVESETIRIESTDQIAPLSDEIVKPLLYTNIKGLAQLPVPDAKEKFISAVLPAILVAKQEIETLQVNINRLKEEEHWNEDDSSYFERTRIRYKAKDIDDLIVRIGTLPNSIVLAQAAVESGWGQSRFFLEGNNLFGIWSFKKDEPRIAAGKARQQKTIFVRSYQNMSESIIHYFEILGSSNAYRSLRKARLETDDPLKLLPHLKNFSERRTSYTNQLKDVLVENNLTQYDNYRIDPEYLVAN
jgi:Bax protein